MPRKRRQHKRRTLPVGLADISGAERALWSSRGPLIALEGDDLQGHVVPGTDRPLYHLWPDVATWVEFYATVRDEMYPADRPWLRERSAAERLYHAYLDDADLDATRRGIAAERDADDPRRALEGGRRHAA